MSPVSSGITTDVLDAEAISAQVANDLSGAVVTFLGVVRNHDAGKSITSIDYTAHPKAAEILQHCVERRLHDDGVHAISAWHRIGRLQVGDAAMVVAVAAEHRGQAFDTTSRLVDAIKAELPVWKCQYLPDGSHSWSGIDS